MKASSALLILIALSTTNAVALDVVIDRVIIKKHPIPAPYFVAMSAKAGNTEQSFNEPKKAYGGIGGIEASEIEIRPKLVLKNVQLNTFVAFTLRLDPKDDAVTTFRALKTHTGRFQIVSGSHDDMFTPELYNTPFIYQVFWHTE